MPTYTIEPHDDGLRRQFTELRIRPEMRDEIVNFLIREFALDPTSPRCPSRTALLASVQQAVRTLGYGNAFVPEVHTFTIRLSAWDDQYIRRCTIPVDRWFVGEVSLVRCGRCNSGLQIVDGDVDYCPGCLEHQQECSRCDETYFTQDYSHPDVDEYCESCTNFRTCYDCGDWHESSGDRCSSCDNSPGQIYNYHSSRHDGVIFRSDGRDTPRLKRNMYGLEFEVAYPEECTLSSLTALFAEENSDFMERFTPTSDSSIGGNGHGVEFVSDPQTYNAWLALEPKLEQATEFLRKAGCRAYDAPSCGAHIHVSRKSLASGEHLVRLYTVLASNGDMLRRLSGRRSGDWEEYSKSLPEMTDACRTTLRDSFRTGTSPNPQMWYQHSRYMCLNLTNMHTLEFRGWRSSLRHATLMEQLDMTRAFMDFTREARSRYTLDLPGIRAWMVDQGKTYDRALTLMTRRLPLLTPTLKTSLKMRVSRRPATLIAQEA